MVDISSFNSLHSQNSSRQKKNKNICDNCRCSSLEKINMSNAAASSATSLHSTKLNLCKMKIIDILRENKHCDSDCLSFCLNLNACSLINSTLNYKIDYNTSSYSGSTNNPKFYSNKYYDVILFINI